MKSPYLPGTLPWPFLPIQTGLKASRYQTNPSSCLANGRTNYDPSLRTIRGSLSPRTSDVHSETKKQAAP